MFQPGRSQHAGHDLPWGAIGTAAWSGSAKSCAVTRNRSATAGATQRRASTRPARWPAWSSCAWCCNTCCQGVAPRALLRLAASELPSRRRVTLRDGAPASARRARRCIADGQRRTPQAAMPLLRQPDAYRATAHLECPRCAAPPRPRKPPTQSSNASARTTAIVACLALRQTSSAGNSKAPTPGPRATRSNPPAAPLRRLRALHRTGQRPAPVAIPRNIFAAGRSAATGRDRPTNGSDRAFARSIFDL